LKKKDWLEESTHTSAHSLTHTYTHRREQLVELPELKAVVNLFLGLGL